MTLRVRPETDRLHVVQEWEGYVLEIVGDEFGARLVDLTAGSSHEEEGSHDSFVRNQRR